MTTCDVINSLSIQSGEESTGVASFVQEACEAVDVLGTHYMPSKIVRSQADFQDLKEYFRRPRVLSTGFLTFGYRQRRDFWNVSALTLFSDDDSAIFPRSLSRLEGVFGVRFKLVFKLTVAATPFHQGLVALSWQYGDFSDPTTSFDLNGPYIRTAKNATCTNLPHVRLDLSTTTMTQLTVPFLSPHEFMELDGSLTLGHLALNVLLPVREVAGLSPPEYRIYVHLEDLELIGATAGDLRNITFQAGKQLKPINEEFENDAYPYSSALHSGSKTLKWIAKGIPSLSSLAGPPAWFLDKAAGIARSFGYAKPVVQDSIVRTNRFASSLEHNVDQPSTALVAGPFSSSALRVDPQFAGTDVDEMALNYVLSQWSQICYGTISDAVNNSTASAVYGCRVCPAALWYREPTGTEFGNLKMPYQTLFSANTNCIIPSNLFYWGQMFKYWRGDLEFRFTFSKTKLHGGRVAIAFYPFRELTPAYSTSVDILAPSDNIYDAGASIVPFGQTTIFDLRDDNVVTFKVPFVSAQPHLAFEECVGHLTMSIVDQVTHSPTIANTIDFLVEVRALPGFELSAYKGPQYRTAHHGAVYYQAGRQLASIDNSVSQYTMGESFTSVKQIIMIPSLRTYGLPATSIAPYFGAAGSVEIMPWYARIGKGNAPDGTYGDDRNGFEGRIQASSCYAFVKGSTDIHLYRSPFTTSVGTVLVHTMANMPFYWEPGKISPYNTPCMSAPLAMANVGDPIHVKIPAHQKLVRQFSWANNLATTSVNPRTIRYPYGTDSIGILTVWTSSAGTTQVLFSTNAGDDAGLGHYMGPVPLSVPRGVDVGVPENGAYDALSVGFQGGRYLSAQRAIRERLANLSPPNNTQADSKQEESIAPPTDMVQALPRPPSPRVSGSRGVEPRSMSGALSAFEKVTKAVQLGCKTTESILDVVNAV